MTQSDVSYDSTIVKPMPALRLRTFGTAAVLDDAGTVLGGVATQRRTLGLLSILATCGDRGCSRDKLLGLLWPETEADRARHSLTQALYATRRALRCDDLFVVGDDIRLNAAAIESDVARFEAALSRADLEAAVAEYSGPFLDGFYVAGSVEFERWQSAQRERLANSVGLAFEQLATRAAASRDTVSAARWWRRLAEIRPLDSRVAVALMGALADSGDLAGALGHARVHDALVQAELGIEPDRAIAALVTRLRQSRAAIDTSPCSAEPPPESTAVTEVERTVTPNDAVPEAMPPLSRRHDSAQHPTGSPVAVWMTERGRPHQSRLLALAVVAAMLVAAGIAIGRLMGRQVDAMPLPAPQRVVVAPFRVVTSDPSLAYLRDGMVELLSTRLADDSADASVDAGGVLGAWRAANLDASVDVPRDSIVDLANRLGARRVIVGSIVSGQGPLTITATMLSVPDDKPLADASITGGIDSLPSLVDGLAAKLLLSAAGEEDGLANRMTRSLPALRAYLLGQSAFRRGDYTAAVRAFDAALQRDTTFALAALRLAITAERLGDEQHLQLGIGRAWASRASLTDRDAASLTALVGPAFPGVSTRYEQVAAWRTPIDLSPSSAEAWTGFGARLFRDGAVADVPDAAARARVALERAISADSNYGPAARLLVQLDARNDSLAEATAAERSLATTDSVSPFAPFLRWRVAVGLRDSAALAHARAAFSRTGPANLRAIVMAAQSDAIGLRDAERALDALDNKALSRDQRVDAMLARHSLMLNRGHPAAAAAALEDLPKLQPGTHPQLRLEVLDALYGGPGIDTVAARRAARQLAVWLDGDPNTFPSSAGSRRADMCVLAQWRLAGGDTSGVAGAIDALRAAPVTITLPVASAAPQACAELLIAWRAVVLRHNGPAAVARLDSLAFTPIVAGDAAAYLPLAIARLHELLGDDTGALHALERRAYMSGWPRYLEAMAFEEAQLADRLHDSARATAAHRMFARLRADNGDAAQ